MAYLFRQHTVAIIFILMCLCLLVVNMFVNECFCLLVYIYTCPAVLVQQQSSVQRFCPASINDSSFFNIISASTDYVIFVKICFAECLF